MNPRRLFLSILITLTIFATQAYGKIHHLRLPSMALIDSNRVIIATPSSFDSQKIYGYPFIIMLHGWSGDETQWEADANLQELCDKYDVLLVLPDGGYDGWWVDAEAQAGRNYDTHIRQELKLWMVKTFNGSSSAAQQGILGLSMGGYGSLLQALKYPGEYAAASSLSGIMDISRHQDKWGLAAVFGPFLIRAESWTSNNPTDLLHKQQKNTGPALQLICGRDDFAFPENVDMATELDSLGYSIDFRQEAGTHSHTFWETHIDTAVAFIVSHFEKH